MMKVSNVNIHDDYITIKGSDSIIVVAKALSEEEIPDAVVKYNVIINRK